MLGGSFALGNKLSQSSSNPFSNSYTATFGGKDGSGLTRATIGQGSLSCTLGGAGYDSCGRGAAEVNRDVSRAQDFSYKHNIDAIKFIYIDPREVAAKTEEAVKRLKSGKLWPDTQALFKGAAERIEEFVESLRAEEAKKAEAEDGAAKKAEAVEGEVAVAEEEGAEKPAKKSEKSQKKKAKEAATKKDLEKEQPEEKESETDKVKLSAAEKDIVQRFEEGQEALIIESKAELKKVTAIDKATIYAAKQAKKALENYKEFAEEHPTLAEYGLSGLNIVMQTVLAGLAGTAHAIKSEGVGWAVGKAVGDDIAKGFAYVVDKGAKALQEEIIDLAYEDAAALVAFGALTGLIATSGASAIKQVMKKINFKDFRSLKGIAKRWELGKREIEAKSTLDEGVDLAKDLANNVALKYASREGE